MELNHPFRLITTAVDGEVLEQLAASPRQYTPGDLHRVTGRSVRGVRLVLQRMVQQGIVREQHTSLGTLYSLNDDHLAVPSLRALASLRAALLDRISAELDHWDQPATYVALFGSAARGDMHATSDLDLFVVRPREVDADDDTWQEQLSRLAHRVTAWTGNDTRILEYGEDQVLAGGEPVLADIAAEGVPLTRNVMWLRAAAQGSST